MASPLVLSNRDARRHFLWLQALSEPPGRRLTSDGLHKVIDRIGFVQLDSIQIVERAHHHILFSRNETYRPKHLAHLYEQERRLFEHWTHDASLIPIEHYPHWRHRHERRRNQQAWSRFWEDRMGGDRTVLNQVRDRLAKEGPLKNRDFESNRKGKSSWWGWSTHKAALEYLWFSGEVAIVGRDGFQKIYDLAERVIPAEHRTRQSSRAETIEWGCSSALARLGAATSGEIAAFWDLAEPAEAKAWVEAGRKSGRLIDVTVTPANGDKPRLAVAFPDLEGQVRQAPEAPERLRALAPFDPALRDRKRTDRLFGFDYRIEVFTPAAKRKYGYYVFPLLEGDRFIGRTDLKADRKDGKLIVKGLWLERGITMTKTRRAKLKAELVRQARLAGVKDLVFPKSAQRQPVR